MEKEGQDSAALQLARPRVNLEYLSENTDFYGTVLLFSSILKGKTIQATYLTDYHLKRYVDRKCGSKAPYEEVFQYLVF